MEITLNQETTRLLFVAIPYLLLTGIAIFCGQRCDVLIKEKRAWGGYGCAMGVLCILLLGLFVMGISVVVKGGMNKAVGLTILAFMCLAFCYCAQRANAIELRGEGCSGWLLATISTGIAGLLGLVTCFVWLNKVVIFSG